MVARAGMFDESEYGGDGSCGDIRGYCSDTAGSSPGSECDLGQGVVRQHEAPGALSRGREGRVFELGLPSRFVIHIFLVGTMT